MENDNSQFEADDLKGREVLNNTLGDFTLFFSANPVCQHDGYLYSGITSTEQKDEKPFTRFIFDVKNRNKEYKDMMVEKKKYDYLLERCEFHKDKNLKPLYINTIDRKVIAWDLSQFPDLEWKWELLPKTTSKQSEKILKEVAYLPVNKSFII